MGSFFKTCKIVTSGFYNLLSLYFLFFASLNVLPRKNWTRQTFGSWVLVFFNFLLLLHFLLPCVYFSPVTAGSAHFSAASLVICSSWLVVPARLHSP